MASSENKPLEKDKMKIAEELTQIHICVCKASLYYGFVVKKNNITTDPVIKTEINVCNKHQLDPFSEYGTLFNKQGVGLLGLQTQFTPRHRLIFQTQLF